MALQFDASEYFTKAQVRALLPTAPLAPTVTQVDVAETYIDISIVAPTTPSWASYATLYIVGYTIVYYDANGDVAAEYVSNVGTTYRLDGLIPGVTYTIQAQGVDFEGRKSPFSASLVATTSPNTVPPAMPVFTVSPLSIGVQITLTTWNTEIDFAGYELYRDTSSALESDMALLPIALFKGVSFIDTDYDIGGSYWFYLKATNYSGLSTNSAVVGPVTVTPQPSLVAAQLDMTTATAVANTDGSITFTFPASTDTHNPYYHIWRQWGGGLSGWVLVATLALGHPPTYNDTNTVSGLVYQYSASVVNDYGESSFDTIHAPRATADDSLAPTAPAGNIKYSGVLGGIVVTWDASEDPNTSYYIIHWRYYQVGVYSEFNAGEATRTNSYLIDGLEDPVTTYPPTRDALANEFEVEIATVNNNNVASAFVARRDTSGNRVPVEYPEINNYLPASSTPPPAPTMGSPTINDNDTITLNWTALGISTQAGFLIEKLTSGSSVWENLVTIHDSAGGSKQYTATGLEPFQYRGTTYTFRVSTLDNTGNLSTSSATSALKAVDTFGPANYTSGFTVVPDFGCFHLSWVNGTSSDYFNCIYEIWRQETASTAPGFTPDSALIKICEVSGNSDGKPNGWTDSSPDINNKVTAVYALRARDQYGNPAINTDGTPRFLSTSSAQTSLDTNDKSVATTVPMGPVFPTTGLTIGEYFYLTAQEGPFAPGLYQWNGTTWVSQTIPSVTTPVQIVADTITAGKLTVGGNPNYPTVLIAEDPSLAHIGEMGLMTGSGPWGGIYASYGAWFKNLGLGGSDSSNPSLYIDNGGNLLAKTSSGDIVVIDLFGNLIFKNRVATGGNGARPSIGTSWADLSTSPIDISASNPAMTVTTRGNPVLVAASGLFNAFTGSGGNITAVAGICSAGSPGSYSSSGPSAVTFAFDFSSGSGSGASVGVSVSPIFGMGVMNPPTGFNYTITLANGGTGYTPGDVCNVTVTVPGSVTWSNFGSGAYTCTVVGGGGTTGVAGVSVYFRILMDGVDVGPEASIATDANGNAYFSMLQLVLPCLAGSHLFEVQAMKSGSTSVESLTRAFFMLELG